MVVGVVPHRVGHRAVRTRNLHEDGGVMWKKPVVTAGVQYEALAQPPTVVVIEWNERIFKVPIGDVFNLTIDLSGSWEGTLRTAIRIVGVE